MRTHRVSTSFVLIAAASLAVSAAQAKGKKPKPAPNEPQDEIQVVGHIPLTGGAVTHFIVTQHYSSSYLYAEHGGGQLTLLDVTHTAHPVVVAELPAALTDASANLYAVAGTAALVTDGVETPTPVAKGQTVRVMDFSDPLHPKVAREFKEVTAMTRDDRRGLIFVANNEGIWILHQSYAEDPKVQEEYARHVMYDH